MKKLIATCAVALMASGVSAYAGDTMSSPNDAMQQGTDAMQQGTSTMQSATNLTGAKGQSIYDTRGNEIGSVQSVVKDNSGQQEAVVSIGQFLGIGGKDVLIPASALTAKAGGGFTTDLSVDQLKALPEYKSQ